MKMKNFKKVIAMGVISALIFSMLPISHLSKTVEASSTKKIFGGAYTLTKVKGTSTRTIKSPYDSKKIKVKVYKVDKNAVLTLKSKKTAGINSLEVGNEVNKFKSFAKTNNSYPVTKTTYTGNSTFYVSYDTNPKNCYISEGGNMETISNFTPTNTVVIQVGNGKGDYHLTADVKKVKFTIDGKVTTLNEYACNYKDVYLLKDLSAAMKNSKSPFTFKISKNTCKITPYKKGANKLNITKKKSVRVREVDMNLVNSLTGATSKETLYKIGNDYAISLRSLESLLNVSARYDGSSKTNLIVSEKASLKSGIYTIKSTLSNNLSLGIASDANASGSRTVLLDNAKITTPNIAKFEITNVGGPWYKIKNMNSGLAIVVDKKGGLSQQKDLKGCKDLFKIRSLANNKYFIYCADGKVFDVYGEKAYHGVTVGPYKSANTSNQKWYFSK